MAGFSNDVMSADNVDFTGNAIPSAQMTQNGQLIIGDSGGNPQINTLTAGTGITITNSAGNIQIEASGSSLADYHTAKYIVSSESNTGGQYTTIASAVLAAQGSGKPSTVFIQPGATGVYTENFTLPANVNLAAYNCDADTPTVTIKGKITFTDTGTSSITGISFQTNGIDCISITGSNTNYIYFNNCSFYATNADIFNVSNANNVCFLKNCYAEIITLAKMWNCSAGQMFTQYSYLSGASITASNYSGGEIRLEYSRIDFPLTTSGTASCNIISSQINVANQNIRALLIGGSGTNVALLSSFLSGTQTCITVNETLRLYNSIIDTTNSTAIDGTGTIYSAGNTFVSSAHIDVTNQNYTQSAFGMAYSDVSSSPYVVDYNEQYLSVDCSGGAITVQLPNDANTGQAFVIKDRTSSAATNNITVTTPGGTVTIDDSTTYVINQNLGSINIIYNGTGYEVW